MAVDDKVGDCSLDLFLGALVLKCRFLDSLGDALAATSLIMRVYEKLVKLDNNHS